MQKFTYVDFASGGAIEPNVSVNPFAVAAIGQTENAVIIELVTGTTINIHKYNGENLIVNDLKGVKSALELAMRESWDNE